MKTIYITIPVTESEPNFDGGEGKIFVARIKSPNGREAAGLGETRLEAVKNLINASGPISRSAVTDYING